VSGVLWPSTFVLNRSTDSRKGPIVNLPSGKSSRKTNHPAFSGVKAAVLQEIRRHVPGCEKARLVSVLCDRDYSLVTPTRGLQDLDTSGEMTSQFHEEGQPPRSARLQMFSDAFANHWQDAETRGEDGKHGEGGDARVRIHEDCGVGILEGGMERIPFVVIGCGTPTLPGRRQVCQEIHSHRTSRKVSHCTNRQILKIVRLVSQDNPGHGRHISTKESRSLTIGLMNGERAKADIHDMKECAKR
jgi:hypothetical protein